MTYSEKLRDPRWQKKRLEILNRDGFACRLCGDTKTTLHIHHEKYKGEPWNAEDFYLKTHCEHCHKIVEYIKDWDSKVISVSKSKFIQSDNYLIIVIIDGKDDRDIVFGTINSDFQIEICARVNREGFESITKFYNIFLKDRIVYKIK